MATSRADLPAATGGRSTLEFASPLIGAVSVLVGLAGFMPWITQDLDQIEFAGRRGAIYGLLWLYGMPIDQDSDANFVPLNRADDRLHFGLAPGMILLGIVLGRAAAGRGPARPGA